MLRTHRLIGVCVALWLLTGLSSARGAEPRLIGFWPLAGDARDRSPFGRHAVNHGAELAAGGARFDGLDDWLEVPAKDGPSLGTGDFTVALWVDAGDGDDVPGDLLSLYDPALRRGFHLSLKSHEVTTSRAQSRTLHFGIDDGDQPERHWTDHGRVGKAVLVFALAVHRGQLFAATCEGEVGQSGGVYRWNGHDEWIDCRIPARCNSVSSLAVVGDRLYAGTARYRLAGSALPESANTEPGGQVLRYESDGQWSDCGRLPETEAVSGMTVFRGHLYAGSLYRPAGFFRYDGDTTWTPLPTPFGKRVEAMCVVNGQLFASSYDEAHVYRFDGQSWTDCGQVGDETNTQTYSFAVYQGKLFVGTWRSGKVYRYDGDNAWADCGRLGDELEVMGMLVHNGRLLAGSLPQAGVFQFDGNSTWSSLGRVDRTPDVLYRRAWTMAEFGGRAFVGTLPSGRVWSTTAGVNVTRDDAFPAGWHHVAARRAGRHLQLFLDGRSVAQSSPLDPARFNLSLPSSALKIGFGANDHFHGSLRDVRLYQEALTDDALRALSNSPTPSGRGPG